MPARPQIGQVPGHDLGGETLPPPLASQLDQQAFLQVTGGDPGGIEGLHPGEDPLQRAEIHPGVGGDLLQGAAQIALFVDGADDQLGQLPLRRGQLDVAKLVHEVVLQGPRLRQRVHQELVAGLGLLGIALPGGRRPLGVVPVLVEFGQGGEVLLAEVQRGALVADRLGLGGHRPRLHLQPLGLLGHLLQHGIGLDLLLDDPLQLQHGRLQNLQPLAQLGGQNHGLALGLRLMESVFWHGGGGRRRGCAAGPLPTL
ncbi:MAG: hypothetical protein U1F77_18700 [Kiritimatiellia bacterium]